MPSKIVKDLPFEEYLAAPGISASGLRAMSKSPLHYQHAINGERKETDAMRLGTATHCAVLEPGRFDSRFVIWEGRRAGNEYKAFAANAAASGQTVLTADQAESAMRIRDAVRAHPVAGPLVESGGEAEVSIFWEFEGMPAKSRLDMGGECIVDLKTSNANDMDPRLFSSKFARLGYHQQLAFYQRAAGSELPVYAIAVESSAPFDVIAYRIPQWVLDVGHEANIAAAARIRECEATGVWPGRAPEELMIDFPDWAMPEKFDLLISGEEV